MHHHQNVTNYFKMQNTTTKILTLIIFTVIFNFDSFGNNDIHIKGQLIEFKSQKEIIGVVIQCFSKDSLINTTQTDKNGFFDIAINTKIDRIELYYIGKIKLKIINVNLNNYKSFDIGRIPLIENPFVLVNWEEKPSRKYLRQEKRNHRYITKGITYTNKCGKDYKIRFHRKKELYQYIDFKYLDCNN